MQLNRKQQIALYVSGGVLAIMLLIPPWRVKYSSPGASPTYHPRGYAFIIDPPKAMIELPTRSSYRGVTRYTWTTSEYAGIEIDWGRLVPACLAVAVLTAIVILGLKEGAPLSGLF